MRQNRSKDKSQSAEQSNKDLLEIVEQLAELLVRTDLSEVRIRDNEFEVQVSRHRENPGVYEQASPRPAETNVSVGAPQLSVEPPDAEGGTEEAHNTYISAPMPSRFYRSPAPDEPSFVKVGDIVATGEPVAVLEVMKTYNPVEAPFNCEILEILTDDGEAVEYAQPLFRVKQIS